MKIRNLTAAVLLGLGTASTPLLISQAHAADMETQALAEQVKARITKLDAISTQAYQRFFSQSPVLQSIKVETGDYQQTDTGLSAVSKVTITRNPALLEEGESEDVVLEMKDNIQFSDELTAQGILARIEGEIVPNDDLKKLLDIDSDSVEEFSKALEYLAISTDLHVDGELDQLIQVKPFEHSKNDESILFSGLNITTLAHEDTLIDGVGKMDLELGQITVIEQSTADSAQAESASNKTVVHPLTLNYELEEDGDMSMQISAIQIESSEDNLLITVDGVRGTGSDIHFDEEIATFIGKQEYVVDEIKIQDDTMPSAILIDSIRYNTDAEKDDDLYDFGGSVNINLNGESIRNLTGIDGLEFENFEFTASFDDISGETVKLLNYQFPALAETGRQEQIEQSMQTLISDMASNETELNMNIALNTDQGDATFVADIKAKEDAVTDVQQWQAAMEHGQEPTAMLNLLQQSFDFDLKLTIPESLIQATGMEGMMAMTAGYVVKEGSDYVLHIENTDDGIELNGNVMPLPQQ